MTLRFLFPLVGLAAVFVFPSISISSADQALESDIGRVSSTIASMESVYDAAATSRGVGWAQMWEVDRECVTELFGYMPDSIAELPQSEREHLLQSCGKMISEAVELNS